MANRYWVGGTASWDNTAGTKWDTVSGGAGGAAVPTASDDVFFDAASGAVTVTVAAAAVCNNLDFTGFTGTFAGFFTLAISGNLTLVAGMTRTYTGSITFNATTTGKTITTNTKSLNSNVTFNGSGGGWTLQDDLNIGAKSFTLTAGSLDTNGKTLTAASLNSNGTSTRALTLGASIVNIDTILNFSGSNLTLNAGTSTINILSASGNFFLGLGLTFNNVAITYSGSAGLCTGTNIFNNLTITGTAAKTVAAFFVNPQTINGTLTINGNSSINRILIAASPFGTPITLTAAVVSISNVDFQDIVGAGAGTWSGTSIGDCLGNSGITFTTPVTRYWVATSGGSWSATSSWSTSSGGASGASVPLPQDTIIFDANSITSGGRTITADMPRSGTDINFTGLLNTPDFSITATTFAFFGSITFISGMTTTVTTNTLVAWGRSSHVFTPGGLTLNFNVTTQPATGTQTLGGNLTLDSTKTLTANGGTFSANNFNIDCQNFTTIGNPTVNMGSGTWTMRRVSAGSVFSISGATLNADTSTIVVVDTGSNTKTIIGSLNGLAVFNNIRVDGSNVDFTQSCTINILTLNFPTQTVRVTSGKTLTVSSLIADGTAGNLITFKAVTAGSAFTLSKSSGRVACTYLSLQDSAATGGATFTAANSTDVSGNSGWQFNTLFSSTLSETFSFVDTLSRVITIARTLTESFSFVDTIINTLSNIWTTRSLPTTLWTPRTPPSSTTFTTRTKPTTSFTTRTKPTTPWTPRTPPTSTPWT